MTIEIQGSDYQDYLSYLDAICEPIGGAINPAVWDEDEQVFVLNPAWIAEQERRGRRVPPDSRPKSDPPLIRPA